MVVDLLSWLQLVLLTGNDIIRKPLIASVTHSENQYLHKVLLKQNMIRFY